MSLRVYTGLPASGKTSAIITEMESCENAGGKVLLILSSEHEALTRRPNVKPQGLMGCRDQNKSYQIDEVIDSHEAAKLLEAQEPGTLVVFDEAQYFQPVLVHGWKQAAERGVDILIGAPSKDQLTRLEGIPHELVDMKVACTCGAEESTHVVYKDDLIYLDMPTIQY
jgi:thymidine kinase